METEKTELELLEAEMKKLHLDIIPKSSINDQVKYLSVEVDIDCEVNLDFMSDLALRKKVMRGSEYYVTFHTNKAGTLTMKIGVQLHQDFIDVYGNDTLEVLKIKATTFPDLCWIHSEGTTPRTLTEVSTQVREGVELGDLTWVMPSKFVDDYVEMMHTLNQGIISGLMQDAIIYGPIILKKDQLVSVI